MPRKKKVEEVVEVAPAAITNQPITETIEKNYMPYVMSVIVSRTIPEIDGFKPSHRKLLYTMYKMGLLTGNRTKSANVVGQTMKLNPHGDAAIYETMVRLTKGNEALLHPFVDSKGSFGKQYSKDMAYAASRYTEVKLDPFCAELFSGIDKNAVDLVPNYDNTLTEPTLLPTTFPNILISPNLGIAVGMASNICSFNLSEICDGTIALLKNPRTSVDKLLEIIKAPDFSGGAFILYDKEQMRTIYETGRGSFTMRARYHFDKQASCLEILQIPYSTTIEPIMAKLTQLIKEGRLKEVTDVRDEIDLNGFKLTLDVRRGTDPDKLMAKLYKLTPLQDNFSCNFNVIIGGVPKTLGIVDILNEWIKFRIECIRREITFDLNRKKEKLHLLKGLGKILVDIDKAISIIRETEKESDVVPRLMEGFKIDSIQAEYIAEIKLRHINREYIFERLTEISELQKEIEELTDILGDELKLKAQIALQLTAIKKKYGKPRKTQLIYTDDIEDEPVVEEVENYNVRVVLTKEGYFKKITLQSLRGSDEHRLKDGDEIVNSEDTENRAELFFFTDQARLYRARVADFDSVKASSLGDFVATKLNFENGEKPIMMKVVPANMKNHNVAFVFENGKAVRLSMSLYETKGNRRRLTGVFSQASPVIGGVYEAGKPVELLITNSANKAILIKSDIIPLKATKSASGVTVFQMKKGQKITDVISGPRLEPIRDSANCRKTKIPATGSPFVREQLTID